MYQTINQYDFIRAFEDIRPENFSRRALQELFAHLEELELDLGEQVELDPIALCCNWAEYTEEELLQEYGDQADLTPAYRYIIDMDERGEFRATVYSVDLTTGEDKAEPFASVRGEQFEEGGEFEGVDPRDAEEVVNELVPDGVVTALSENEELDTDDALEQTIERLQEEGGEVLTVEHCGAPTTYLVRAN